MSLSSSGFLVVSGRGVGRCCSGGAWCVGGLASSSVSAGLGLGGRLSAGAPFRTNREQRAKRNEPKSESTLRNEASAWPVLCRPFEAPQWCTIARLLLPGGWRRAPSHLGRSDSAEPPHAARCRRLNRKLRWPSQSFAALQRGRQFGYETRKGAGIFSSHGPQAIPDSPPVMGQRDSPRQKRSDPVIPRALSACSATIPTLAISERLTNFLLGELREDQLWAVAPNFYEARGIDRMVHARAARRRPSANLVAAGTRAVALRRALGRRWRARAGRRLFRAATAGVLTLRTIQRRATRGRHAAGKCGAPSCWGAARWGEWTHALLERGVHVTLVERAPRFIARRLDAVASDLLAARLRKAGVDIVQGEEIALAEPGPSGGCFLSARSSPTPGVASRAIFWWPPRSHRAQQRAARPSGVERTPAAREGRRQPRKLHARRVGGG